MNGINQPLVSIIVNCYNSDKYLKETLDSIISQSYQNWEVVFWDNQSTDNSAAYLKSYNESRFKYFYAPDFEPLSTARNLAVKKAMGELIAFLDCDDVWSSDKLKLQVESVLKDKNVGIVYTKFELILSSTGESAKQQAQQYRKFIQLCTPHPAKNIFEKLLLSNYIIFSSVLFRMSIFEEAGGFKENLSQNEDYNILLKTSLLSSAVCLNYIGVKYRIHSVNNSYANAEKNFIENKLIYADLPRTKVVEEAEKRNEVKYKLFKIFIKKDLALFKLIRSFSDAKIIGDILIKRFLLKIK